jgi:hypothetical protein
LLLSGRRPALLRHRFAAYGLTVKAKLRHATGNKAAPVRLPFRHARGTVFAWRCFMIALPLAG